MVSLLPSFYPAPVGNPAEHTLHAARYPKYSRAHFADSTKYFSQDIGGWQCQTAKCYKDTQRGWHRLPACGEKRNRQKRFARLVDTIFSFRLLRSDSLPPCVVTLSPL